MAHFKRRMYNEINTDTTATDGALNFMQSKVDARRASIDLLISYSPFRKIQRQIDAVCSKVTVITVYNMCIYERIHTYTLHLLLTPLDL